MMRKSEGKRATAKLPMRANSPVAVILRTHLLNEKFYDLLNVLSMSGDYDLFVAVDETFGRLDVPGHRVLSHSIRLCRYFDLYTKHPNILWHCGDYALYFCALQIPNYQYYVLIEYDVDLVRRSPFLLTELVSQLGEIGSPDFIAAAFHEASPDWCWTEAAAKRFPVVYTTSTFAFVAISAAALDYLYERRKQEALACNSPKDLVMCEAFCASALVEGGFVCASLNSLIEGAVDFSTFHPPIRSLETSQYLLNQYTIGDPKIEIVHPVYDLPGYLEKQFGKVKELEQLPQFLQELDGISVEQAADAELISEYREMCLGTRSRLSERVSTERAVFRRPFVKKRTVAVLTDSMSPGFYFPLWYRYYSKLFGASSIHLMTLQGCKESFRDYDLGSISEMDASYDDDIRLAAITERVAELTRGYDYVIRLDSDEFLIPEPSKFDNLSDYMQSLDKEYVTARGFDVFQHSSEPDLDLELPILADQRHYAFGLTAMNKTCITSVPLRWNRGFHCCSSRPQIDDLFLFHLKRADIQQQIKWNKFLSKYIQNDTHIRSYYEVPEDKILLFHTDFSNPARRESIRGEDALYRTDFTEQFLESTEHNTESDLYEGPYVLDDFNVIIPESFRGKL